MLFLHVFSLMQHPSGGHIALYIATTAGFIALLMTQHIKATTTSVSSSLLVEKTQVMNVKQLYLFIFFYFAGWQFVIFSSRGQRSPMLVGA